MSVVDCYLCPITHQFMMNPYIDNEGNSYELDAIEKWLLTNQTSPITRNPLYSYQLTQENKKIIWTDEDKIKHKNNIKCAQCNCKLGFKDKVAHHDHITGKYISTLCNDCNLLLRYKKFN